MASSTEQATEDAEVTDFEEQFQQKLAEILNIKLPASANAREVLGPLLQRIREIKKALQQLETDEFSKTRAGSALTSSSLVSSSEAVLAAGRNGYLDFDMAFDHPLAMGVPLLRQGVGRLEGTERQNFEENAASAQTRIKRLNLDFSGRMSAYLNWLQQVSSSQALDSRTELIQKAYPEKPLLVLFDGTNNSHSSESARFSFPSNVLKLFRSLKGDLIKSDKPQLSVESSYWTTPQDGEDLATLAPIFTGLGFPEPMVERQRALYVPGVGSFEKGDSNVSGKGILPRIVWAWLWVSYHSRNSEDTITFIGFSRGAYTARIIADLVATRGILPLFVDVLFRPSTGRSAHESTPQRIDKHAIFVAASRLFLQFLLDSEAVVLKYDVEAFKETPLSREGGASSSDWNFISDWPATKADFEAQKKSLKETLREMNDAHTSPFFSITQQPVSRRVSVAVWDTVSSIDGSLKSTLKNILVGGKKTLLEPQGRIDSRLWARPMPASEIKHALHAVALDETRIHFTPLIFKPNGKTSILQRWFCGAHSDVGGSYPCVLEDRRLDRLIQSKIPKCGSCREESALSDVTLAWMLRNLIERPAIWCLVREEVGAWAVRVDAKLNQLEVVNETWEPDHPVDHVSIQATSDPDRFWEKAKLLPLICRIDLMPSPYGISHVEGKIAYPRLYACDLASEIIEHSSVALRKTSQQTHRYIMRSKKKSALYEEGSYQLNSVTGLIPKRQYFSSIFHELSQLP